MATRTFGQDFNALSHGVGDGFATFGACVGRGLTAMGPFRRRIAVTAFGAVLALSLGAATASAFRLPSEVTDPAQPQDQMLAQSELPSEAAARAYALENPPLYTVAADHGDDAAPAVDAAVETTAMQDDDAATPAVSYTAPADDQAAAQTQGSAPTVPATASDADNAAQAQN